MGMRQDEMENPITTDDFEAASQKIPCLANAPAPPRTPPVSRAQRSPPSMWFSCR